MWFWQCFKTTPQNSNRDFLEKNTALGTRNLSLPSFHSESSRETQYRPWDVTLAIKMMLIAQVVNTVVKNRAISHRLLSLKRSTVESQWTGSTFNIERTVTPARIKGSVITVSESDLITWVWRGGHFSSYTICRFLIKPQGRKNPCQEKKADSPSSATSGSQKSDNLQHLPHPLTPPPSPPSDHSAIVSSGGSVEPSIGVQLRSKLWNYMF